ncbi:LysR family transcriptional regulator [Acuticoccus sp. M5D2P5]|uniref:LysR family transcriptional regulator n=1 Tax=Acuticoccus kalidii TaxID=2910977 RepID=UPI001F38FC64|nr:LysR family transcriptional regulator [Acuticoccus kalidii]MCF3934499.1 LysR family transcriptional regulator [Acuticoccus kalidii]
MEIRQLQYFVEVARSKSFSRAAVALGVAQPALSRQVQQLEAELTVPLFYRNGRGVSLTSAGELLLSHANEILSSVSRASSEVAALRGQPTGSAVIGVPPSVGRVLTLPLAQKLKQEFPMVSVKIVEGFSGHILEWLGNGRIDVGIFYDDPMTHRFVLEPLAREALYLIGPAEAHRDDTSETMQAASLFDLPLILPSRSHGLRLYLDDVALQFKRQFRIELEVDALFSMIHAVRDGMGYTILPQTAILNEPSSEAFRCWRLTDPDLVRVITMSTYGHRPDSVPTQQICRIVRQEVRGLIANGYWSSVAKLTPPDTA